MTSVGCRCRSRRLVHGRVWRSVRRTRRGRRCYTPACLRSPTLRLQLSPTNDGGIDFPAPVVRVVRRQALCDEVGAKDRRQDPANVPAEGQAECTRACERSPVALGCQRAAGDAVDEVFQAGVAFDGFRWGGLR